MRAWAAAQEEVREPERAARAPKAAEAELEEEDAAAAGTEVKRWRALPPERAVMDYSKRPMSAVAIEDREKREMNVKSGGERILAAMKKKKGGGKRAVETVKVSVEGRGLYI